MGGRVGLFDDKRGREAKGLARERKNIVAVIPALGRNWAKIPLARRSIRAYPALSGGRQLGVIVETRPVPSDARRSPKAILRTLKEETSLAKKWPFVCCASVCVRFLRRSFSPIKLMVSTLETNSFPDSFPFVSVSTLWVLRRKRGALPLAAQGIYH